MDVARSSARRAEDRSRPATGSPAENHREESVELAEARTKLASADDAVLAKKMVTAEQLAEQSRTEAELASARTGATKAKLVNEDMSRSTGTLIDEMQRNAGEK
jgi:hypothetical protein